VTRSARRVLALGLAGSALSAQVPPAPPEAVETRLRRVQERRQALERELTRLRAQERTLLGEVERLTLEERLRGVELGETTLLLERTNAELDATVQRERERARAVDEARPLLAARARALYKLGELSYLRILLSVERPSDFFRGYRYVTALARRDNARLVAFRADLAGLRAARAELEARTREALALRAELTRQRASLAADRTRKTALLREIADKRETHAAYLRELTEAEARLARLLEGLAGGEAAVPIAAFRGSLPWPVAGRVRVPFGPRKHPRFDTYTAHNGLDIEAPPDAPVAAVHEGSVAFADRFQGYGPMVVVDHGGKHYSLYAHLSEIAVEVGERVAAGQRLGGAGEGVEGPGIYFEMRFQGRPEDPAEWLRPSPN
jgi:septal ring factor EnvC (AmiA/AmiB activator)